MVDKIFFYNTEGGDYGDSVEEIDEESEEMDAEDAAKEADEEDEPNLNADETIAAIREYPDTVVTEDLARKGKKIFFKKFQVSNW